jgi:hypothetical protein
MVEWRYRSAGLMKCSLRARKLFYDLKFVPENKSFLFFNNTQLYFSPPSLFLVYSLLFDLYLICRTEVIHAKHVLKEKRGKLKRG